MRNIEDIGKVIVDAAFNVHRTLGPGLLESAYQACLAYELNKRGISIAVEKSLPLEYDGLKLDAGYRIDILVEEKIILELKAVKEISPIHMAQMITYLRLSNLNLGFIINFNEKYIRNGIKRVVHNYKPED